MERPPLVRIGLLVPLLIFLIGMSTLMIKKALKSDVVPSLGVHELPLANSQTPEQDRQRVEEETRASIRAQLRARYMANPELVLMWCREEVNLALPNLVLPQDSATRVPH